MYERHSCSWQVVLGLGVDSIGLSIFDQIEEGTSNFKQLQFQVAKLLHYNLLTDSEMAAFSDSQSF